MYEVPGEGRFTETEGRRGGTSGMGEGELVFNGDRVSVWGKKRALEVDAGIGGPTT